MRTEPTLAARTLPKSILAHRRVPMTFRVEGGLRYIKGNQKPYFTLTYAEHRKGFPNQCWSGGAGHDTILKHFPHFAQLAKLHLSDIDGAPMHAEANGWYDLAGALPGHAGERFHVGSQKRHFPKPEGAPRVHEFDTTDYREPTPDECLQIFADHVRIDIEAARSVMTRVHAVAAVKFYEADRLSDIANVDQREGVPDWTAGRAWFGKWIDQQRPRWKAEAESCIAEYGLAVFGDEWPAVNG